MEIERKWLVDEDKFLPLLTSKTQRIEIENHYINDSSDLWIIRASKHKYFRFKLGTSYYLTLKSKGLLAREELQYPIDESNYLDTIKHSLKSIKKKRYLIPIEGHESMEYEVDIYEDYDFITCEVEFKSEKEANNFMAPDWKLPVKHRIVTLPPEFGMSDGARKEFGLSNPIKYWWWRFQMKRKWKNDRKM